MITRWLAATPLALSVAVVSTSAEAEAPSGNRVLAFSASMRIAPATPPCSIASQPSWR